MCVKHCTVYDFKPINSRDEAGVTEVKWLASWHALIAFLTSLALSLGVVIPLGFCGAMGNAASRVAVVVVFLVRAQGGARRGTEAILLHWRY